MYSNYRNANRPCKLDCTLERSAIRATMQNSVLFGASRGSMESNHWGFPRSVVDRRRRRIAMRTPPGVARARNTVRCAPASRVPGCCSVPEAPSWLHLPAVSELPHSPAFLRRSRRGPGGFTRESAYNYARWKYRRGASVSNKHSFPHAGPRLDPYSPFSTSRIDSSIIPIAQSACSSSIINGGDMRIEFSPEPSVSRPLRNACCTT
jgi:hypothetical protein